MTAQMYDRLKYNGSRYHLAAAPLEAYFAAHKERRPVFTSFNTACAKGYIADWMVCDNKLYLVGMEMMLDTDATFETLFPDAPEAGVFAEWVSGVLACPHGELLRHDRIRFTSVYEAELILTVEKGAIVSAEEKRND